MSEPQTFGTGPKRKSWFLRHKILTTLLGLFLLGVVISATSSGGTSTTASTSTATDPLATAAPAAPTADAPTPEATTAAPASPPADAGKPNDKGWVLQSFQTADDGVGDFGGTARITNTNDAEKTATFTITLARSGAQVGSLQGSAQQVAAGKTVTVQLISQDKYSAGMVTSDFQTDISY